MKAMATTAKERGLAFRARQRFRQRLVSGITVVPPEIKCLVTKGYLTAAEPTDQQLQEAVQAFLSDQLFE